MFNRGCLICGNKNLKKYYLCDECSSLINEDVTFSKRLEYVDEVIVGMDYVGLGREMILDYKFKEKTYLVKFFSELLIKKILDSGVHKTYKNISYVPMFKSDLNKRGFNQSALIAKEIAESLQLNLISPVKKAVKTKEQVELSSEKERKMNILNTFIYEGDLVDSIILVDDVITTGATINELAKIYKLNGTKKVAALVAATQAY